MKRIKYVVLAIALISTLSCVAQNITVAYKKIDTTELNCTIYLPDSMNRGKLYPAIIFFFGGGWNSGNISQFEPHAKYFSKKGIICFLVDYRTKNKNKTTPFESVKDAKSAVRYIRQHATEFFVDTSKIIASGGSAGGHLAAAAAFVEKYNELTDDTGISCKPNALVLFNPIIDNGPGGYGYERIGGEYRFFSPLHNINTGAPPTIILIGTEDKLIPVETVKYYKKVMEKVGSRCDLILYEGAGHGFFNYKGKYYENTIQETQKFLKSLGYLSNY